MILKLCHCSTIPFTRTYTVIGPGPLGPLHADKWKVLSLSTRCIVDDRVLLNLNYFCNVTYCFSSLSSLILDLAVSAIMILLGYRHVVLFEVNIIAFDLLIINLLYRTASKLQRNLVTLYQAASKLFKNSVVPGSCATPDLAGALKSQEQPWHKGFELQSQIQHAVYQFNKLIIYLIYEQGIQILQTVEFSQGPQVAVSLLC